MLVANFRPPLFCLTTLIFLLTLAPKFTTFGFFFYFPVFSGASFFSSSSPSAYSTAWSLSNMAGCVFYNQVLHSSKSLPFPANSQYSGGSPHSRNEITLTRHILVTYFRNKWHLVDSLLFLLLGSNQPTLDLSTLLVAALWFLPHRLHHSSFPRDPLQILPPTNYPSFLSFPNDFVYSLAIAATIVSSYFSSLSFK